MHGDGPPGLSASTLLTLKRGRVGRYAEEILGFLAHRERDRIFRKGNYVAVVERSTVPRQKR